MPYLPKETRKKYMPKKRTQLRQYDNSSFYNSIPWRRTRNRYIKANPLCEEHSRKGETVAGQCVDHIIQMTKGGPELDESNLQTLCNSCHAKKNGQEAVEYRNGVKVYKRKK